MNQIDCKQAQNVWSRVMAAQAGAQSTSANPPVQVKAAQEEQTASITPEQLLSSIEYEMLDAVTKLLPCACRSTQKKCSGFSSKYDSTAGCSPFSCA